MAQLNLQTVGARVRPLGGREEYDRDFIFDLLAAYGRSKSSITRLRNGSLNIADDPEHEVAQKDVVYFKPTTADLYAVIDELRTSPTVVRFKTRFVIVTDYQDLLAVDTKTGETLAIKISKIDQHFTFFLPWAGMEKAQYVAESHADVKAAERIAKLYDELISVNRDLEVTTKGRHALNVFFTRLLFCFFAEDTNIFDEALFSRTIEELSQPDGSDVHEIIGGIFEALDTPDPTDGPSHFASFPYVNGKLFAISEDDVVPTFTAKARTLLLESGRLLWSEINPDIFGSMFQAIVTPGQRSDLGQHYTSVPNILKTIEPLFLDALKEELNSAFDSVPRLQKLHDRIAKIKVFDPACGSGNFLIIAYKELRRLEHAILERLAELDPRFQTLYAESKINIENFYGIELDDFATEIAVLSMWIAKHQMNQEFYEKFKVELPLIPLREVGQIIQGNAIYLDWLSVCPRDSSAEIYVISNPPYRGSRRQSKQQKAELKSLTAKYRSLDYVSGWFIKGAEYIRQTGASLAFVSTNSITQGEQVSLLWPTTLGSDIEIGYAYRSFLWSNHAKGRAGVTCVVLSLRPVSGDPKYIFAEDRRVHAKRINPYLIDAPDLWIGRRQRPLSTSLPKLGFGSMPNDGGNLLLSKDEQHALKLLYPQVSPHIRRYMGSDEFINGKERWCLVIPDSAVSTLREVPEIAKRLDRVREHRANSSEASTQNLAAKPNRFYYFKHEETESIIVPAVSSESRTYIPVGYVSKDTVANNRVYVAHDTAPWLFALLTSQMHMAWVGAVSGRLESRYSYSNTIVYNNFPVPTLIRETKEKLTSAALRVLDVREYHSEKTLAQLYDPAAMPDDLRLAHQEVDDLVDRIYRRRGFETDEERLSLLFSMYEEMTEREAGK